MKLKYILRFALAASLALLVGFGLFSERASARPHTGSFTMQFRSFAKNDGSIQEGVDEYGDPSGCGAKKNSAGNSIFVGDDARHRSTIGILDFLTAPLPDGAYITGAYLQLHVTSFTTRYGNPYDPDIMLGDLYADIAPDPGYYGDFPSLETDPGCWGNTDDFTSVYYDMFDYFSYAVHSGDTIFLNFEDPSLIDPTFERTQIAIYFGNMTNYDNLSQGLKFASGNHPNMSWRPVLTVFYDYP